MGHGVGILLIILVGSAHAQELRVLQRKPNPYGSPRPSHGMAQVPLRTSIYFELELREAKADDGVLTDSITLNLQPEGGVEREVLRPGWKFAEGARGWRRPSSNPSVLTVYVEPGFALEPATRYAARVDARSREGLKVSNKTATWHFTTESAAKEHAVELSVNLATKPVRWHGGFFNGICNVVFCTHEDAFGDLYRMMRESHSRHPRAWRLQRDINLFDTDDRKAKWQVFF